MQFLKNVLASFIGTFVAMFLVLVVFVIIIIAAVSSGSDDKQVSVKDNSILHIVLDQEVVERGSDNDVNFNPATFQSESKLGLNHFIQDLEKAKSDDKIKRVVMCSGKVYFDLLAERDAKGLDDVYLLRIEQLYPVPSEPLKVELARFKWAEMVWCQEEPKNMGAWFHIEPEIEQILTNIGAKHTRARYAGRVASASPATGLASKHKAEQTALVEAALGLSK
ncbi:MAG: hypothetical protein EAZ66_07370 [Alphaproteobacteria bacterium]|nr:MAG: hypothetical protein EAZ66_07370 [Alphaproteobacteria bacterium]